MIENFQKLSREDKIKAINEYKQVFGPLMADLEKTMAVFMPVIVPVDPAERDSDGQPNVEEILKRLGPLATNTKAVTELLEKRGVGVMESIAIFGGLLKVSIDLLTSDITKQIKAAGLSWNVKE